jgi:hypothetical protein
MGDGVCDPSLDCADFSLDDGDCDLGCGAGLITDCLGECITQAELDAEIGNDVCTTSLDCLTFNNDGGDCEALLCEEEETANCSGTCVPVEDLEDSLANGECDDELNCEKFSFDVGYCGSSSTCDEDLLLNCLNGCVDPEELLDAYGDGFCNAAWGCTTWEHDGNDCSGYCVSNSDLDTLGSLGLNNLKDIAIDCLSDCQSGGICAAECVADETGMTVLCSSCVGNYMYCMAGYCGEICDDPNSLECLNCAAENCDYLFIDCAGFSPYLF